VVRTQMNSYTKFTNVYLKTGISRYNFLKENFQRIIFPSHDKWRTMGT
jgi:hypothetical protein